MNLSGKRTRIGRNSGERPQDHADHPRGNFRGRRAGAGTFGFWRGFALEGNSQVTRTERLVSEKSRHVSGGVIFPSAGVRVLFWLQGHHIGWKIERGEMMTNLKRTALYPLYAQYGARTVDFAGWELPVQFSGIQKEHEAVRTRAGLFDVSHMGEFRVRGAEALPFLQRLMTNDIARMETGQALYTFMCYPEGGVIDDLIVYKMDEGDYMLVVNAANIGKDFEWLQKHREGDAPELIDLSDEMGLLALQGPAAERILAGITEAPVDRLESFRFLRDVKIGGYEVAVLSRTGYTGEDGFELYAANDQLPGLWEALMAAGESEGLVPAGLGARDTLRFEARLPLYGQELSPSITPLEAGLGFFVKLDKGDFVGREALARQKEEGPPRRIVGIEMIDRGIPRTGYAVYDAGGQPIGEVTTGTQSPTLKKNIGLVLIDRAYAAIGTEVWVEVRGKRLKAEVVPTPFYKRKQKEEQ